MNLSEIIEKREDDINDLDDMIFKLELEVDAAKALRSTLAERMAATKRFHNLVSSHDFFDFERDLNDPRRHLNLLEERVLLIEKWINEHDDGLLSAQTDALESSSKKD